MDSIFRTLRKVSVNINGIASGFWISQNLIITAGHVVNMIERKGEGFKGIYYANGMEVETKLKLLKCFIPNTDLAIFSAETSNDIDEVIPLASVYNVGQDFYSFGYLKTEQLGRYIILRHIGNTIFNNENEILVLQGNIPIGFSGSCIFNPITQAICGVITSVKLTNGSTIEGYAISATTLENCIKEVLPTFETGLLNQNLVVEDDEIISLTSENLTGSRSELINKVQDHLSNFEIKESIHILKKMKLKQTNQNDLIIIGSKYVNYARNKNLGIMPYEQIRIEEAQIIQGLLMILNNVKES